jgi:hypothetical protein
MFGVFRKLRIGLAVCAESVPALVVQQNGDDVGTARLRGVQRRRRQQKASS